MLHNSSNLASRIIRGRVYYIVDKDAAAEVAEWLLNNRRGRWADDPGLRRLQPTLSRMRRKERDSLSDRELNTMSELLAFCPPISRRLWDAILAREGWAAMKQYQRWVSQRLLSYTVQPRPALLPRRQESACAEVHYDPPIGLLASLVAGKYLPLRDDTSGVEAKARRENQAYVLARVLGRDGGLIERFVREQLDLGHDPNRLLVAALRCIEPLLDSPHAAFIERDVDELSDPELERFIKAGVERERILLSRSPQTKRAQEAHLVRGHERTTPAGAKELLEEECRSDIKAWGEFLGVTGERSQSAPPPIDDGGVKVR
jgi:hypothetical protein